MKTFRNRFYTARNFECTNVVACRAAEKPKTDNDRWVESPGDLLIRNLDHLYTEAGVQYFGHL